MYIIYIHCNHWWYTWIAFIIGRQCYFFSLPVGLEYNACETRWFSLCRWNLLIHTDAKTLRNQNSANCVRSYSHNYFNGTEGEFYMTLQVYFLYIYLIWDLNFVINVPAYGLALNSARPSADAVLTTKSWCVFFFWLSLAIIISEYLMILDNLIQNGHPGPRPTNGILIECEIWSNFGVL